MAKDTAKGMEAAGLRCFFEEPDKEDGRFTLVETGRIFYQEETK